MNRCARQSVLNNTLLDEENDATPETSPTYDYAYSTVLE
jgi:hypothetical protein